MKKLSFKEYLDSKEQLRHAISNNPIVTKTYQLNKYCKLPVNEGSERLSIALTPKTTITVDWLYEDAYADPHAQTIRFSEAKDVDSITDYEPSWKTSKFNNWIIANTEEV